MKIRELFEQNTNKKLVLPDFQRDFEWNVDAQKRLLASILVHLPIGSLLILTGRKDDFATKKLCFAQGEEEPKEECLYLLDGQQRLSSLKCIFSDFFDNRETWKDIWEGLYRDLRKRWFICVKPNDEEDIFGWYDLRFNNIKKFEPTQILDFIYVEYIFKTKTEKWYNPGYKRVDDITGEELDGSRLKNYIASIAAKEFLIPLYTVYSPMDDGKKLHTYVIEKIAQNRVDELKAEVNDGKRNIEDVLEEIEPDIRDFKDDEEKIRDCWARLAATWVGHVKTYLEDILEQKLSVVNLPTDEINRAISIFESINKGGTPLNVYDLVVARAARNKGVGSLNLRIISDLNSSFEIPDSLIGELIGEVPKRWSSDLFGTVIDNKIDGSVKDNYLNLLSIISNTLYGFIDQKSDNKKDITYIKLELVKRPEILDLSYEDINENTASVIKALKRTYAFLHFRCGVINVKSIQYKLMVLPIAYLLYDENTWNDKTKLNKIEYWYWTMLFSGAYRERQNKQCIDDIKNLYYFIHNGKNHFDSRENKVLNDPGYSDENVLLRKDVEVPIPTAIHNGILQYIISTQPRDFLKNELRLNAWDIAKEKEFDVDGRKYNLRVQDHHICPLSNATNIGESTQELRKDKDNVLNSILNRTYISEYANKEIRDIRPLDYFRYVSECSQWGHCIPTPVKDKYNATNCNNSEQFYESVLKDRYNEIKKTIKQELDRLKY